ncbi:MAG TPA: iron-containing redox enzyme family protein [Candidatus Angelobacter sp.]|nr:iron-containing redox enzyme family protein [Candidatus Angelobacter sp.]
MNTLEFHQELDSRIARHDLLTHPFYRAWAMGELTREDLRQYAMQYFHHVAAFPDYLEMFESRPQLEAELAQAVAENRAGEDGHAELWLDFAEGMGADRAMVAGEEPLPEIQALIETFQSIAREGSPAEALAAFYAYESQVPRIAQEKARGLFEMYGADAKTCGYFTLHQTADVHHARVWNEQLEKQTTDVESQQKVLAAGERIAQALWRALDGVERERLNRNRN